MDETITIDHGNDFLKNMLTSKNIHNNIIKLLISLFIFTLSLWLASGLVHMLIDVFNDWNKPWRPLAENIIVNSLGMLALLEIIKTLQCYLEIGRVRVTFILDATLVALIGEFIGLWYRNYTIMDIATSIGVITSLVILRIITKCYSPYLSEEN